MPVVRSKLLQDHYHALGPHRPPHNRIEGICPRHCPHTWLALPPPQRCILLLPFPISRHICRNLSSSS